MATLWTSADSLDPIHATHPETLMKPSLTILLIGLAFTLAACNTVQGIGQDVQRAGNVLERSAR